MHFHYSESVCCCTQEASIAWLCSPCFLFLCKELLSSFSGFVPLTLKACTALEQKEQTSKHLWLVAQGRIRAFHGKHGEMVMKQKTDRKHFLHSPFSWHTSVLSTSSYLQEQDSRCNHWSMEVEVGSQPGSSWKSQQTWLLEMSFLSWPNWRWSHPLHAVYQVRAPAQAEVSFSLAA